MKCRGPTRSSHGSPFRLRNTTKIAKTTTIARSVRDASQGPRWIAFEYAVSDTPRISADLGTGAHAFSSERARFPGTRRPVGTFAAVVGENPMAIDTARSARPFHGRIDVLMGAACSVRTTDAASNVTRGMSTDLPEPPHPEARSVLSHRGRFRRQVVASEVDVAADWTAHPRPK